MIICPICKHTNPPNATTCHQCNIQLDDKLRQVHRTLTRSEVVSIPPCTLTILPTGISLDAFETRYTFAPTSEFFLGREFVDSFERPHLDLQVVNARMFGVSRIHARIQLDLFGQFQIIDMGSTNGTLLNDERITPFLQHLLTHGDRLHLGKLPILIQF